jgi:hypothetical protein
MAIAEGRSVCFDFRGSLSASVDMSDRRNKPPLTYFVERTRIEELQQLMKCDKTSRLVNKRLAALPAAFSRTKTVAPPRAVC